MLPHKRGCVHMPCRRSQYILEQTVDSVSLAARNTDVHGRGGSID